MDQLTILALSYLDKGWAVIPCHIPVKGGCSCGKLRCSWPGKHPRLPWKPFTEKLPTPRQVRRWFSDEYYGSNIGIVTGPVSRLAVVDVDGGRSAYERLELPKTLEAITGGGGRHYYYRCDRRIQSRIRLLPGIDLKADGGFVVAPPSIHVSGRRYMWRWTVKKLPLLDPARLPLGSSKSNDAEWFDDLLTGVHEGERSITAARLAGRYAQLGLTPAETLMLMSKWNKANIPPLPGQELRATIRAVYRKHDQINVESVEDLYQLLRTLTGRGGKGR